MSTIYPCCMQKELMEMLMLSSEVSAFSPHMAISVWILRLPECEWNHTCITNAKLTFRKVSTTVNTLQYQINLNSYMLIFGSYMVKAKTEWIKFCKVVHKGHDLYTTVWILTFSVHTNSLTASDQTLDSRETRNGANEARFPHFST